MNKGTPKKIRAYLVEHPDATREEIAKAIGDTPSAVDRVINKKPKEGKRKRVSQKGIPRLKEKDKTWVNMDKFTQIDFSLILRKDVPMITFLAKPYDENKVARVFRKIASCKVKVDDQIEDGAIVQEITTKYSDANGPFVVKCPPLKKPAYEEIITDKRRCRLRNYDYYILTELYEILKANGTIE